MFNSADNSGGSAWGLQMSNFGKPIRVSPTPAPTPAPPPPVSMQLFQGQGDNAAFSNQWEYWYTESADKDYVTSGDGKREAFDTWPLENIILSDGGGEGGGYAGGGYHGDYGGEGDGNSRKIEYELIDAYKGMSLLNIIRDCLTTNSVPFLESGGNQSPGGSGGSGFTTAFAATTSHSYFDDDERGDYERGYFTHANGAGGTYSSSEPLSNEEASRPKPEVFTQRHMYNPLLMQQ